MTSIKIANILSKLVKKNIGVICKSVSPSRITSNLSGTLAAVNKLSEEDVAQLDGLAASGKQQRFITPPWGMYSHFKFQLKIIHPLNIFSCRPRI